MKSIALALLLLSASAYSQEAIDLIESTLKLGISEEKEFYFGFAEGDQIVLNVEIIKGKHLGEIEVCEYPSSIKFTDYETKTLTDKKIRVSKDAIYKFRFTNKGLLAKICKIRIQRIPLNESTKQFDSEVHWKTYLDTTYTNKNERYLIKTDTTIVNVVDQVAKVHSIGNMNGNKTSINFTLPANTKYWSYYIGVDQSGQQAYKNATEQLTKFATPIVSRIPGYGPTAALALGLTSYITQIQNGEDIDYYLVTNNNAQLFNAGQAFYYVKKGKVINDFSRLEGYSQDTYFICLSNDNAVTGVSVMIKVTAIVITEQWGTRIIKVPVVKERKEAYLKGD